MNYEKHYQLLIEKAINRNIHKNIYTEKHHIMPKCMGGNDNIENIVELLPAEHFVAHQLLVKMFPKNKKLIFACNMMVLNNNNQKRNNKEYAWLKIKRSILISELNRKRKRKRGYSLSNDHKRKISEKALEDYASGKRTPVSLKGESNGMFGKKGYWKDKKLSKSTKEKISKAHSGKSLSTEHKKAISFGLKGKKTGEKNGMFGKKHSDKLKQEMSKIRKGKTRIHNNKLQLNKTIDPNELENYLKDGWVKGMLKRN